MQASEPLRAPQSVRVLIDADHETPETQPLLESDDDDGDFRDDASMRRSTQWERHVEPSLATVQPSAFRGVTVRESFIRQILGLNPFRTSYFALYRPLDDLGSRTILFLGILLAIAAGVPLPIIGTVLGKIINTFPPPEDELRALLFRLMSVAVCYFVATWGWAVCWAVIGERVSRKTRERLLHRALGMDMAYFDTVAPDMSSILTEKTQTIQLGTSEKVGLFIASISYFVSAFTVGFTLNARLTGVMFVTVIPSMACVVIFGTKSVSRLSKEAAIYTEKAASVAESAIRGVQIVQAFGLFDRISEEHIHHLRSALRVGIKKSVAGAVMLGSGLPVDQVANETSLHRQRCADRYSKLSRDDMMCLLGDATDELYPVYMQGPKLVTLCTAVFDLHTLTCSIYQGNPRKRVLYSQLPLIFPIP